MIRKFVHSSFSEKYHKRTNFSLQWYFDMTLADMDIGVHEQLHQKIMKNFNDALEKQCNIKSQQKFVSLSSNQVKTKRANIVYQNCQKQAEIAIINWYNMHFQCELALSQTRAQNKNQTTDIAFVNILFCPSIVSLCSYCIMSLTNEQDSILIMTPVYASYANIIKTLNRKVVTSKMKFSNSNNIEQNMYRFYIDQQDFSDKIINVKMLLLCHPHNPSGRVWSKQQINYIVNQCKQYGVIIVSDQILSDLSLKVKQKEDDPQFYSLCRQFTNYDKIIVVNSISKSFNYASLQGGYAITANSSIKQVVSNTIEIIFEDKVDLLGIVAIKSCLSSEGQIWLSIIKQIILANYEQLIIFKNKKAPYLKITELQSAYLVFIDMSIYFLTDQQMIKQLNSHGIWVLNMSSNYIPNKEDCRQVRICIACSNYHFNRFIEKLELALNWNKVKNKSILTSKL